MATEQEMRANIGRMAETVENKWTGKVVRVERHDGDLFYRMHGVDRVCFALTDLPLEKCVSQDDTQWYAHDDVVFILTVTVQRAT